MASIISTGMTKFGKRPESLLRLAAESSENIIKEFRNDIDFLIASNAYSGEYNDISGLNNLLTTYLSLDVPSMRVDNTSGSGGSAITAAAALVDSGQAKAVLVVGAEKMNTRNTKESSRIIASLLPDPEKGAGLTLPSLGAFLTRAYIEEFGAERAAISKVSVKNRFHASMNPYAHFQKPITLQDVENSKIIADPLHLLEYCPISDGAASVLVASDDFAQSSEGHKVHINSIGAATNIAYISERKTLTTIKSVKEAAEKAFKKSSLNPDEIDVVELHDMTAILEIVESEDIGLFEKGEGWKAVMKDQTMLGGKRPINTSGGLNSKGHPIGASGIAQAVEVFHQLTGTAGERQIKNAKTGISISMAGFGNNTTAILYGDAR